MKPHVYSSFIYAIVMTLLAFIVRDTLWLTVASLVSIAISFTYGGRRVVYLLTLVAIGLFGVFVNALVFANTGPAVAEIGFLTIRRHALEEFTIVSLRLLLIAGAGGVFALTHSSSEIARGLTKELGLPYSIALAVSYALRSIPLIKRDLEEVLFMRKQRGYSRIPLKPSDLASILTPLLSVNYNRAVWSGISAEIRGLRLVRTRVVIKVNLMDLLLLALITALLVLLVVLHETSL
ncbi:MAG: energy-coupling factor transporter transmembrane component T [Desulfurococcus sp.]|nr:energy-coupling factor transporter transmembrane component T [Desulfurococcus sp.]